jgi:hypothetical protein
MTGVVTAATVSTAMTIMTIATAIEMTFTRRIMTPAMVVVMSAAGIFMAAAHPLIAHRFTPLVKHHRQRLFATFGLLEAITATVLRLGVRMVATATAIIKHFFKHRVLQIERYLTTVS